MTWLCWHVGTVGDPKIAAVAKRCGNVPKHVVVAFWAYLLEVAANGHPKGSVDSLDIEGAAIQLDASEEILVALLKAMEAKGMIDACQIVNWDKRQHGTSTERVKAHRERKKQDETLRNGSETKETPTVHNKTEQQDSAARENVSRENIQAEFEEFYQAYPCRRARGQAWKAYQSARKKTDAPTLLAGAKRYAVDPSRKPDFTAHPSSWLNGERWLDESAVDSAKRKVPTIAPVGSPEWTESQRRLMGDAA